MKPTGAIERMNSIGIWTWLLIVEKEADKLSAGGRAALGCLRQDLERLAGPPVDTQPGEVHVLSPMNPSEVPNDR